MASSTVESIAGPKTCTQCGAHLKVYNHIENCKQEPNIVRLVCDQCNPPHIWSGLYVHEGVTVKAVKELLEKHGKQVWRYEDGWLIPVPDQPEPADSGEVLAGTLWQDKSALQYRFQFRTQDNREYELRVAMETFEELKRMTERQFDHAVLSIKAINQGDPPRLWLTYRKSPVEESQPDAS